MKAFKASSKDSLNKSIGSRTTLDAVGDDSKFKRSNTEKLKKPTKKVGRNSLHCISSSFDELLEDLQQDNEPEPLPASPVDFNGLQNIIPTFLCQNDISQEQHLCFWPSIQQPNRDAKEAQFSTLNRSLQRLIEDSQQILKSRQKYTQESFAFAFFTSYGFIPKSKNYILLYRLLFEILPGPPENFDVKKTGIDVNVLPDAVCSLIEYWHHINPVSWLESEMMKVWNGFIQRYTLSNIPPCVQTLDGVLGNSHGFHFDTMNMKTLASQMTVIDHKNLKKIGVSEFYDNAWQKHADGYSKIKAPNIVLNIVYFNNLVNWVTAMMVKGKTPKEQVKTLSQFISLCRQLHKLGNYNSLMALHAALSGSIVHSMKKTFALLEYRNQYIWSKIDFLMNCENNYAEYRKELDSCINSNSYCLPYLGVILRDLTFLQEVPNTHEDMRDQINWKKSLQIAQTMSPLFRIQHLTAPKSDEDLNAFIHIMLIPRLSYRKLMRLSKRVQQNVNTNSDCDLTNSNNNTSKNIKNNNSVNNNNSNNSNNNNNNDSNNSNNKNNNGNSDDDNNNSSHNNNDNDDNDNTNNNSTSNNDNSNDRNRDLDDSNSTEKLSIKRNVSNSSFQDEIFDLSRIIGDTFSNITISETEYPHTALDDVLEVPETVLLDFYTDGKFNEARSHITRMVEAIFNMYVSDNSGTINKSQFEHILDAFPFIDDFETIDTDNNGSITYTEMHSYLMITCLAQLLFKKADRNNDKKLCRDEFQNVIQKQFPQLTFNSIDADHNDEIDSEELKVFMLKNPSLVTSMVEASEKCFL